MSAAGKLAGYQVTSRTLASAGDTAGNLSSFSSEVAPAPVSSRPLKVQEGLAEALSA